MSRSHISAAAIALAFCLFAGAANAIPMSRGEDISNLLTTPPTQTRTFGATGTPFGSLPALFSSLESSSWFGSAEQGLVMVVLRLANYFGGSNDQYGQQSHESARGFWRGGHDLIIFIWSNGSPQQTPTGTGTGSSGQSSDTPSPTPLPAPLVLLGSGLGLIGFFARRRRKQAAVAA